MSITQKQIETILTDYGSDDALHLKAIGDTPVKWESAEEARRSDFIEYRPMAENIKEENNLTESIEEIEDMISQNMSFYVEGFNSEIEDVEVE